MKPDLQALEERVTRLEEQVARLLDHSHSGGTEELGRGRGAELMASAVRQVALAETHAHEIHQRVQELRAEVKSMERRLDMKATEEPNRE